MLCVTVGLCECQLRMPATPQNHSHVMCYCRFEKMFYFFKSTSFFFFFFFFVKIKTLLCLCYNVCAHFRRHSVLSYLCFMVVDCFIMCSELNVCNIGANVLSFFFCLEVLLKCEYFIFSKRLDFVIVHAVVECVALFVCFHLFCSSF
jgi:hypothetical protein